MVKKADVVISNYLPGTMDKLGIGLSRAQQKLTRIHFRRSIDIGEPQSRAGGGLIGYVPWANYKYFMEQLRMLVGKE